MKKKILSTVLATALAVGLLFTGGLVPEINAEAADTGDGCWKLTGYRDAYNEAQVSGDNIITQSVEKGVFELSLFVQNTNTWPDGHCCDGEFLKQRVSVSAPPETIKGGDTVELTYTFDTIEQSATYHRYNSLPIVCGFLQTVIIPSRMEMIFSTAPVI